MVSRNRHSSRIGSQGVAVVLSLGLLAGFSVSTHAAPPEKLTLRDMAGRPDRWPESVKVSIDADFGGGLSVKAGTTYRLLDFNGSDVVLQVTPEQNVIVAPNECDLLEAGNAMWSALTPAQREVDAVTLARDASLWPAKVTVNIEFGLTSGEVIPAGTEYDLAEVDGKEVKIFSASPGPARLSTAIGNTDLIKRARDRALIEPEQRPSRIAEALKANRIDAQGNPLASDAIDESTVFVLYFGASWCGPCRQFSPEFVKFMDAALPANPKMTVVMLNADENEAEMLKYMQSEKMPFPAVKFATLKTLGAVYGYGGGSIPQLVVTDRHGKVLANTFENGRYANPKTTLAKLKRILDAGAAK